MYKVIVFVPADFKEKVKKAMFESGGGKIGNYSDCCFEVKGMGQFRPLKGSSPFLGEVDDLEVVEEYKVEMVVPENAIKEVIRSMKKVHPYEEPAYDIFCHVRI